MKTITILGDFDAYPDDRTLTAFREGDEADLPEAFADLLIEKGLGRVASRPAAAPKPTAAETAPQKDTAP